MEAQNILSSNVAAVDNCPDHSGHRKSIRFKIYFPPFGKKTGTVKHTHVIEKSRRIKKTREKMLLPLLRFRMPKQNTEKKSPRFLP